MKKSYEHIMRHLGQGDADAQRIAGWMAERKNDVLGHEKLLIIAAGRLFTNKEYSHSPYGSRF